MAGVVRLQQFWFVNRTAAKEKADIQNHPGNFGFVP
jgi:hypothetical protein